MDSPAGGELVCGWASTESSSDTSQRTNSAAECEGPRFLPGPPRTQAAMHVPEGGEEGADGAAAMPQADELAPDASEVDLAEGEDGGGDGQVADLFGSVAKGKVG